MKKIRIFLLENICIRFLINSLHCCLTSHLARGGASLDLQGVAGICGIDAVGQVMISNVCFILRRGTKDKVALFSPDL